MADAVYQVLERMLPALEDLQEKGIFTEVSEGGQLWGVGADAFTLCAS
jgi:hypothetical protein